MVRKKKKKQKIVREKNIEAKKAKVVLKEETVHRTKMRIIGIGGGGNSIVSEIAPLMRKVDCVIANTDLQALKEAPRRVRQLHFGQNITNGLGCGMDPKLGQKAVREERNKIVKLFHGIDLAVIVSSLGGGTGSGAAPEFAAVAKEMGVLTVGIFTLPFKFEGSKRAQIAKHSLERLTPDLNIISIIPNENIFKIIDKNTPLKQAFSSINKRLAENLRGLIEMVYLPGLINIDFADLKTILDGKGQLAYLNTALAAGQNRAEEAMRELLQNPLNEYSFRGAEKIVFNITAPRLLGMQEVEHISQNIFDFNRKAKIIFGVSHNNNYKDSLRVTLLAVGVHRDIAKKKTKPKIVTTKSIQEETLEQKMSKKKIKNKMKQKPRKKQKPRPKQKKLRLVPKLESKEILELPAPKPLMRKNALELKKETERTEEEIIAQEKKWDVPAFLRKKETE